MRSRRGESCPARSRQDAKPWPAMTSHGPSCSSRSRDGPRGGGSPAPLALVTQGTRPLARALDPHRAGASGPGARGGLPSPRCSRGGCGPPAFGPRQRALLPGSSWLCVGAWAPRSRTLCGPRTTSIVWGLIFFMLVTCDLAASSHGQLTGGKCEAPLAAVQCCPLALCCHRAFPGSQGGRRPPRAPPWKPFPGGLVAEARRPGLPHECSACRLCREGGVPGRVLARVVRLSEGPKFWRILFFTRLPLSPQ